MKTTPWAKLTIRMMPKISVSPHAMKNRIDACESALRHCARMKPNQFIGCLARTRAAGGRPGERPPAREALAIAVAGAPAIRRRHLTRIDLDDLAHRFGELL